MRKDLNFSEMNEFTICNENIGSIFVEITCSRYFIQQWTKPVNLKHLKQQNKTA